MIDLFCLFFAVTEESHQSGFPSPSQCHTHRETCTLANRLFVADFISIFLFFSSPFFWTHLPRYPCRQNRASLWPHRSPALAILTGRCSARRSDRGHNGRCCCTAPGSRLSKHPRARQRAGPQNQEENGSEIRGQRRGTGRQT